MEAIYDPSDDDYETFDLERLVIVYLLHDQAHVCYAEFDERLLSDKRQMKTVEEVLWAIVDEDRVGPFFHRYHTIIRTLGSNQTLRVIKTNYPGRIFDRYMDEVRKFDIYTASTKFKAESTTSQSGRIELRKISFKEERTPRCNTFTQTE